MSARSSDVSKRRQVLLMTVDEDIHFMIAPRGENISTDRMTIFTVVSGELPMCRTARMDASI